MTDYELRCWAFEKAAELDGAASAPLSQLLLEAERLYQYVVNGPTAHALTAGSKFAAVEVAQPTMTDEFRKMVVS